jgi:uncharacterized protein
LKHPIPRAALDDRLGFIGTSGSGKTYNAGTAIEILLAVHHARGVIIDPLGVWWGLRLLADGKKPSNFNVVIFGGDHADLPLNEQAGALIGETAACMAESCIIDLSKMPSRSAERRFMVAFLETIYRKAGGEPFHLIVDEADLFAPQKPQAGDEVLLGHMENIVRRGRVRGFIPWLISQRPAVLNKNVLSQVDGLLAFKLTASQDRDALDAWIEGQADKAQGKAIKDALPTFKVGEGIVWLPSQGILDRKSFPPKVTFDSSRKPKRGEKLTNRKLKPLDVGKLKDQLATVVEEAKANDPKELRKRIADLEAAAKKAPAIDPKAVEEAEKRGFERGKEAVIKEAQRVGQAVVVSALTEMKARVNAMVDVIGLATEPVKEAIDAGVKTAKIAFPDVSGSVEFKTECLASSPKLGGYTRPPAPAKPGPVATADGSGSVTPAKQRILDAIAWMASLGNPHVAKDVVAFLADASPNSSAFANNLGALRSAGLIDYPSGGMLQLTEDGVAAANPPEAAPTHAAIMQKIGQKLAPAQMRIVSHAAHVYPNDWEKGALAEAIGASATSSAFANNLGRLRTLGLITYPASGRVRADDRLFP